MWRTAAFAARRHEPGAARHGPAQDDAADARVRLDAPAEPVARDPSIGAAVVYGTVADANHIGVVVRVKPLLLSVKGNTSIGGECSRNGVAVDLKEVNRSRVVGYIVPLPR